MDRAAPALPTGDDDAQMYRLLVNTVKDYAIFLLDPDGRIASWNLGAEKIKGYRADEIIGRHFSVFYPRAAVESGWPDYELAEARKTGRFEDHGWRVRKDGSLFWANVLITALRDDRGELRGFAKITRDLSERRQYEETLRESEERFRLLLDGIEDYAIFMLDPEGRVVTWNAGAKAIGRFESQQILGRSFEAFYPDDARRAGKPERDLELARDAGHVLEEDWRVRRDGSLFWASIVLTAIRDEHGTLRGYAQVLGDMSERKRLEELEHSSRRMNEFLAMLAHELRNPLAPIRNAVELMRREPPTHPLHVRCRDMIDRQVTQLKRLVDDLLDVSRVTAGTIRMQPQRVDVAEIVRHSLEASELLLRSRDQLLEVQLPSQPLWVQADPLRLSQVFQNLLNNASKFTPAGGRIGIRAWAETAAAAVEVSDSGVGIAAADLESIFELFAQGSEPAPSGESGLGVGLSLVRSIVNLHGGAVTAMSPGPGQGSQFRVRLPLLEGGVRPDASQGEVLPEDGRRTVLVVDDNRDAADSLALLLESMGHRVTVAYSGAEALAQLEARPADVVFLDISMPGMDGYEVARVLRRRPLQPRLVAITGFGAESEDGGFRDSGFETHLVKPVGQAELARALTGLDREFR